MPPSAFPLGISDDHLTGTDHFLRAQDRRRHRLDDRLAGQAGAWLPRRDRQVQPGAVRLVVVLVHGDPRPAETVPRRVDVPAQPAGQRRLATGVFVGDAPVGAPQPERGVGQRVVVGGRAVELGSGPVQHRSESRRDALVLARDVVRPERAGDAELRRVALLPAVLQPRPHSGRSHGSP
jgi:hypothetical protein